MKTISKILNPTKNILVASQKVIDEMDSIYEQERLKLEQDSNKTETTDETNSISRDDSALR